MNLKEFLKKNNNTTLITEATSCKTREELEALAKANDVQLSSEELEKFSSIMKKKTALLSDEELDDVAGAGKPLQDRSGKTGCYFTYKWLYRSEAEAWSLTDKEACSWCRHFNSSVKRCEHPNYPGKYAYN